MRRARKWCDGITRRDVLRVGAAGALGLRLTLPRLLELQARAADGSAGATDLSVILVFLQGGLSTIDTFDLKPDAPADVRGEFKPIGTNAPGIQIGEQLPRVARQMDKISLIRSFTHRNASHGEA